MEGKCHTMNTVYKCITSVPTKPDESYIELSEDERKKRYYIIENRYEANVINRKQYYPVMCEKQNVLLTKYPP